MDNSNLLVGRPFGGCAIMYCKSLLACVKSIPTNSKRFHAVKMLILLVCLITLNLSVTLCLL